MFGVQDEKGKVQYMCECVRMCICVYKCAVFLGAVCECMNGCKMGLGREGCVWCLRAFAPSCCVYTGTPYFTTTTPYNKF